MGDPTQQVHDFEPGIAPSGLFWTRSISPSPIDVVPGIGRARFHAENVAVPDFFNFFNAISPSPSPPPLPSHVSFDLRWNGRGARRKIRDRTFGFAGEFVEGTGDYASIGFSAANDGADVTYTSVAAGQNAVYAAVGHERNGIFFS